MIRNSFFFQIGGIRWPHALPQSQCTSTMALECDVTIGSTLSASIYCWICFLRIAAHLLSQLKVSFTACSSIDSIAKLNSISQASNADFPICQRRLFDLSPIKINTFSCVLLHGRSKISGKKTQRITVTSVPKCSTIAPADNNTFTCVYKWPPKRRMYPFFKVSFNALLLSRRSMPVNVWHRQPSARVYYMQNYVSFTH